MEESADGTRDTASGERSADGTRDTASDWEGTREEAEGKSGASLAQLSVSGEQ